MNFLSLLNTVITLALVMAAGFIGSKLNVVDDVASKKLSLLILRIGQPFLILSSILGVESSKENLALGFKTLLIGFAIHIFIAIVAFGVCAGYKHFNEKKLSEFAIVFGNVGFMGFPILESLYGAKGLFMGVFIVISFNILLWSLGIFILGRGRSDMKLTIKKVFINFGTVPSFIGLIVFISGIRLPDFVYSTASYLGSLCTPISLIITGALLAKKKPAEIFLAPKIYFVSFVRLIVIPLLICTVAKLIGFDYDYIMFLTVVTAMPCAAIISMLAELYDINPGYAAQSVGTSSLLSIATMPCVLLLAEKIATI
jgi:predicted permease